MIYCTSWFWIIDIFSWYSNIPKHASVLPQYIKEHSITMLDVIKNIVEKPIQYLK